MKIALAAFVVLATIAVNTVMVDCGDSVIDHEGSICYRNWWKVGNWYKNNVTHLLKVCFNVCLNV